MPPHPPLRTSGVSHGRPRRLGPLASPRPRPARVDACARSRHSASRAASVCTCGSAIIELWSPGTSWLSHPGRNSAPHPRSLLPVSFVELVRREDHHRACRGCPGGNGFRGGVTRRGPRGYQCRGCTRWARGCRRTAPIEQPAQPPDDHRRTLSARQLPRFEPHGFPPTPFACGGDPRMRTVGEHYEPDFASQSPRVGAPPRRRRSHRANGRTRSTARRVVRLGWLPRTRRRSPPANPPRRAARASPGTTARTPAGRIRRRRRGDGW